MQTSFKKYAKLMNLKENTEFFNRLKAIWENECYHDWVDSFRDTIRYVNFSPEHDTYETRICMKCKLEEEDGYYLLNQWEE